MATIIDLDQSAQATAQITCDVCIVGAGAAGLYLANRLGASGSDVVILEAGGLECRSGESLGIEPTFTGSPYRGATEGRAFGWGGSTSRWGGLLVPHSDLDLRCEADAESPTWRHIVEVVKQRTDAVFATLGLGTETDFRTLPDAMLRTYANALHQANISTLAAEFLPFRRRNLTYLLSAHPRRAVTVYLNAVACRSVVTPGPTGRGVVESVHATTRSGKQLDVTAKSFVIAAGAIESARILLEIDRVTHESMIPRSAATGRYLADHLSCPVADVQVEDRDRAARLFGPVFVRGRMRSFRFVVSDDLRCIPKHFSHFIFEMDSAGLQMAKHILFSLQARTRPAIGFSNLVGGLNDLLALVYYRFMKSRLHVPSGTPSHLQLDIEQTPAWENRVHLGNHADRFGRPVAVVHWHVRETDQANIRVLTEEYSAKWPEFSLGFPRLVHRDRTAVCQKPYDAYHPVGTCRMGSGSEATVDLNLIVKGTANLYVLSTGVFPSAGTANPTFSMLCLGDLLAEQLANTHCRSVAPLTNSRPFTVGPKPTWVRSQIL